ncbi:MAG: hypothetical protein FWH54_00315, partial [Methanobrevibacter sp.]|nr:hypothetical protein [Methanobrevibacter sp.]
DSINNFDFQNLCFPIIIKPSDTNEYSYYFPTKERNYIFENEEDAFSHIKLLFSSNYKGRIIIQEYIPGGAESLFTCTTYSNINGKIKAVSTGCKLSQYPSNAGTITSGLVKYNSEIITKTKTLLEANYYFGIANTEYKFDKRDNTYKLMEINARPGMWNYSSFLSGINIIKYLVDDLIYNKTLLYSESTEMLIWTRNIKKKIKINVNNYENKEIVKILLKEKKIFNPLNNKNDGLIFKIRYYLISIKEYLKFIINR